MSEELTPMSDETTEAAVMPEAEAVEAEAAEAVASEADTVELPAAELEEAPAEAAAAEPAETPAAEAVEAPVVDEAEAAETVASEADTVELPAAELEEAPAEAAAAEPAETPAAEVVEAPVVDEAEAAETVASEVPATEAPVAETPAAAEAGTSGPTPKSIDELKPGMELTGTVKRIELYGAFVDLGIGKDGLLHISQLGKADVRNVEDVVQVGQKLSLFVLKVDKDQGRIALSLMKPVGTPWEALKQGMDVSGTVVKIENFGVFVDFGAERPGMIHVSELASGYVRSPEDVVSVGETVTARVIKLDRRKKRIDLSLKAIQEKAAVMEQIEEETEQLPTAMELALRRAMQNGDPEKARIAERRARRERQDPEMDDIISRTLKSHQNQK